MIFSATDSLTLCILASQWGVKLFVHSIFASKNRSQRWPLAQIFPNVTNVSFARSGDVISFKTEGSQPFQGWRVWKLSCKLRLLLHNVSPRPLYSSYQKWLQWGVCHILISKLESARNMPCTRSNFTCISFAPNNYIILVITINRKKGSSRVLKSVLNWATRQALQKIIELC